MLSIGDPAIWFRDLFIQLGLGFNLSVFLSTITLIIIVLFFSWLSNLIAKTVILRIVAQIIKRTETTWDDVFLEQKVFSRLSHFAPVLVIWFSSSWALKEYPVWLVVVHKLTYLYIILIATMVIISFIESWHQIYNTLPIAQHRHIKGYVQLLKIFVILIALLIVVSVIFKKDISSLLTGIGAMAAVLLLVFKDTLLGLVASIQLSADKMLKVGDWITIPKRDVDGTVTDITLNTVKIQNFDKSIITLPTYSLVNESFQNWKGMEEAGVRRIKRSVFIDMRSIRFLDKELYESLSSIPQLKEYIDSYEKQNIDSEKSVGPFFNRSQLTNLGVFRYYAEIYLKNHPAIDEKQTLLVRHRDPVGNGLPLQVSVFTKNYLSVPYENLQSEIFEHLLAIMDKFGLKIFQQPTGSDLLALSGKSD
jgi:miniconductance mechanosensitive channel